MASIAFEEYKNKLNNLRPALDDLGGALHLDEARNEVEKLEEESAQDGFWNDTENSQRVQKRIKTLKHKLERYAKLSADNEKVAREIAQWKHLVLDEWNNIRIVSYTQPDASYSLSADNTLKSEVVLDLGRLKPEDIGVEMLFTVSDEKGKLHLQAVNEFKLVSYENGKATYQVEVLPERTGMYQVGTRIYPKNPLLPHRQDFPLVKWL